MDASFQRGRARPGFTLVELMVVVIIIGLLAGLMVAGVMPAIKSAKNAAIAVEINQLDMAMRAYKEKYGDYPPDFAGISSGNTTAQNLVLRHLRKAFPKYVPGVYAGTKNGTWAEFAADVSNYCGLDVNDLHPGNALPFWLGGPPATSGSTKLRGFSANPANPFQNASLQPSLFEFDEARLVTEDASGNLAWPQYFPKVSAGTDPEPYVYFEARGGQYEPNPRQRVTSAGGETVIPYGVAVYDGSNWVADRWLNPKTFQIICAGLDGKFGGNYAFPLAETSGQPQMGTVTGSEYDNLTNFSNGILEDMEEQ